MDRRSPTVLRAAFLSLVTALSATAQSRPDLREFAAAVPGLRTRIAAEDWEGFAAAARPFMELQPDPSRCDEVDDMLYALQQLGVWGRTPEDAVTRGLLADTFGETAIADACYKEHLTNGPARSWLVNRLAAKSTFVGYRARLAVQRGELDLAQSLLGEQRERLLREEAKPQPGVVEAVDVHLRAVRDLAKAPADPWQRLAFARSYWGTTWLPLSPLHAVRRDLERLLDEPAVRKDRPLLLAIRCEQIALLQQRAGLYDPRVVAVAVACVDDGLVTAAAHRRDVADPWSPLRTIGRLLQWAKDPARALTAFDALVAGAAALPQQAALVRDALLSGAECAIERGDAAGTLARLERAEREFPYKSRHSGCGTPRALDRHRVMSLRKRAQALHPR